MFLVYLLKGLWVLEKYHEVYENLCLNVHVVGFDEIWTEFRTECHFGGLTKEIVIERVDAVNFDNNIFFLFVDSQHADQARDNWVI